MFSQRYFYRLKHLTDEQLEWLVGAWKDRFVQLKEAERVEVEQTLEVLFMPDIKPYLEIYNAEGGFSSLPSFGDPRVTALVQGTPHTETQQPVIESLSIARSICSCAGPSGDDTGSSSTDDARSSEWLDISSWVSMVTWFFPRVKPDLNESNQRIEGADVHRLGIEAI